MADIIRINDLPEETAPVDTLNVAVDGAQTRRLQIKELVDTGAPISSQAEAEAGTDPSKRMTPLTTRQATQSLFGVPNGIATLGSDGLVSQDQVNRDFNLPHIPYQIAGIGAADMSNAAAFDNYVGPPREVTVDPSRGILSIHDGGTLGGKRLLVGNESTFENMGEFISAEVPETSSFVIINGYYAPGDGGYSQYKRAATEPSHDGKVQSADGAWWEFVGSEANILAFGAMRSVKSPSSDPAISRALSCATALKIPLVFPSGEFYGFNFQEIGGVKVLFDNKFTYRNSDTEAIFPAFRQYGRTLGAKFVGSGGVPENNASRDLHSQLTVNADLGTSGAGTTHSQINSWYEGTAENAYLVGNQNFYSFLQYGEGKKAAGARASGTVSIYGGHINVFSVERKSGGTGRSEITPLAIGVNFKSDAAVGGGGGINIYNDVVVSGPVNSDAFFRESFMAGLSLLVNKYTPGNGLDANHNGSYGLVVATRPATGGFAPDSHTTPSYPQRAGLVVAGFSGPQGTVDGLAAGATNGFDVAFLAGGGEVAGFGGGSQWLSYTARSKFSYGFLASDYTQAGIRLSQRNGTSAFSLWADNTSGPVRIDTVLRLTALPTSATGLTAGDVWKDAANGNVLKVV